MRKVLNCYVGDPVVCNFSYPVVHLSTRRGLPPFKACGGRARAVIAERLSARLLIVQRSQLAFVRMYIRHTLITWARFLWSRPQTTRHVVLVRPGGDRKIVRVREPKRSRGHMVLVGAGGD